VCHMRRGKAVCCHACRSAQQCKGILCRGQRADSCQLPSRTVAHLLESSGMGDNGERSHEDGMNLCCETAHLTTKSDLQSTCICQSCAGPCRVSAKCITCTALMCEGFQAVSNSLGNAEQTCSVQNAQLVLQCQVLYMFSALDS